MNDILPGETPVWRHLEACIQGVLHRYGFREIRLPIVEHTELFARSIGAVTDIVEKEMYTFTDRNGDSLSLRPEGTASCVRAGEEHGLLYNQEQRLWYRGPMFRHERPQKGRYRQFHQVGVEVFGLEGPDIDAELLLLCARLWRELGLSDQVQLQLNSLGDLEARHRYRDALVAYLQRHLDALDEDARRRLDTNPLRILDTKNPQTQAVLEQAPVLWDHLEAPAKRHFEALCTRLSDCGVAFEVNPRLVRGLDYYGKTVFEWVTDSLGAQGTVCAGGRYDGLVEQLGGRATPAVGFAMGLERLVLMLCQLGPDAAVASDAPDLYLLAAAPEQEGPIQQLAETLRTQLPHLAFQVHMGGGSMKSKMKKADRSGAEAALLMGADELASASVTLKPLRTGEEQVRIPQSELTARLAERARRAPEHPSTG